MLLEVTYPVLDCILELTLVLILEVLDIGLVLVLFAAGSSATPDPSIYASMVITHII